MSNLRAFLLAVGLGTYLLASWLITMVVANASAYANGPCLTNDCPEGEPSAWVWIIPVGLLVGFVALAIRGARWVSAKRSK